MKRRNEGEIVLILIAGLCVLGMFLVMLFAPYTMIGAGSVGVVTTFGKVDPDPLPAGFHLLSPMAQVSRVNVQVQKAENQYAAASKDLQTVDVVMIINYRINPDSAPNLYQHVGEQYLANLILPAASESLKAEIALHNATEILEQRPLIKKIVHENMSNWPQLKQYGIVIDEISLSNISFSKEYEHAIEQKQLQEQLTKQKEYELMQTKLAADMAIAKAKGDSESKKLEADGAAYYNEKLAGSITDKLLAAKYYDKWDGKLPQYMLGNSSTLMQIPGGVK